MILTFASPRWAASQSVETSGSSVGAMHLTFRLLRLELLRRTAGVAPGAKSTSDVCHRLQPHILRGLCRQGRAHAAGAMKDELLVLLENRFGIGAQRVDPEFQHAAGAGKRVRNPSLALDLSGIADIDDHDVIALRRLDGVRST